MKSLVGILCSPCVSARSVATMQSRWTRSRSQRDCFAPLAMTMLCLITRYRRLGTQRSADFLFGRPPIRALDLGDALADDVGRRLHLVEAAGVGAEELGLIFLRQPIFLHGFDRAPSVVAVMVIHIGRPAQNIAVKFR